MRTSNKRTPTINDIRIAPEDQAKILYQIELDAEYFLPKVAAKEKLLLTMEEVAEMLSVDSQDINFLGDHGLICYDIKDKRLFHPYDVAVYLAEERQMAIHRFQELLGPDVSE